MQTDQTARERRLHVDSEESTGTLDNGAEMLQETTIVVSLSGVYFFCTSVLRSLTIRNAWNAVVPKLFGLREISRKEAAALRFLFKAFTLKSYVEHKEKTIPSSKEMATRLITGISFEIALFFLSVLSLRQVRKANAKVETN